MTGVRHGNRRSDSRSKSPQSSELLIERASAERE
jgi:hypothetical protein